MGYDSTTRPAHVWVEIGTADIPAAVAFYGELSAGHMKTSDRRRAATASFARTARPRGSRHRRSDRRRARHIWAVYLATDDVTDTAHKVEANGGKVILAPLDVMGQGMMAVFTDPAGAYFSVWQPGAHVGSELLGEPGSLGLRAEFTRRTSRRSNRSTPRFSGWTTKESTMGPEPYTLVSVGGTQVAGFSRHRAPMPCRPTGYPISRSRTPMPAPTRPCGWARPR